MVNMLSAPINNNIYTERKTYSKLSRQQVFQQKQTSEATDMADMPATENHADIQDIYEQLKAKASNDEHIKKQGELAENRVQEDVTEKDTDPNDSGLEIYYQGVPLQEWALTDPRYTDPETGISWYIRDGKYPYMVGDDAKNFQKLCQESGEFALKKFADMTGLIQQLDDNTVAYIGDNGIAVKSKDGKEMFIDTSDLAYDTIMNMFKNLPKNGVFFS